MPRALEAEEGFGTESGLQVLGRKRLDKMLHCKQYNKLYSLRWAAVPVALSQSRCPFWFSFAFFWVLLCAFRFLITALLTDLQKITDLAFLRWPSSWGRGRQYCQRVWEHFCGNDWVLQDTHTHTPQPWLGGLHLIGLSAEEKICKAHPMCVSPPKKN